MKYEYCFLHSATDALKQLLECCFSFHSLFCKGLHITNYFVKVTVTQGNLANSFILLPPTVLGCNTNIIITKSCVRPATVQPYT